MESVGRWWQRNEDCCGPRSFLDCVRLANLEFRGRRGSTGFFCFVFFVCLNNVVLSFPRHRSFVFVSVCVVALLLLVACSVNTNEFDAYKSNWLFLKLRFRCINISSFPVNRTKLLCNGILYVSHEFLFAPVYHSVVFMDAHRVDTWVGFHYFVLGRCLVRARHIDR